LIFVQHSVAFILYVYMPVTRIAPTMYLFYNAIRFNIPPRSVISVKYRLPSTTNITTLYYKFITAIITARVQNNKI